MAQRTLLVAAWGVPILLVLLCTAAQAPRTVHACVLASGDGPCVGDCGGDGTCVFVDGNCECADAACAFDEYYQKCAQSRKCDCLGHDRCPTCIEFEQGECGCREPSAAERLTHD